MTTDELYNEPALMFGETPAAPLTVAVCATREADEGAFNNDLTLTATNPERLLGLTTAEAIALAEASGACGGTLHCLQVAANHAAGGWGNILRSPHALNWFQWFAHNVDEAPDELQPIANMITHARMTAEAEYVEVVTRLVTERMRLTQSALLSRREAVHHAQTTLLKHWAGGQIMTVESMDAELRRLSNVLAASEHVPEGTTWLAFDDVTRRLCENETPAVRDYIASMRQAAWNYRIAGNNADAFYKEDRKARSEWLAQRIESLKESLAQYLIMSKLCVRALPVADSLADVLDSLADVLDSLAPDA